MWRRNLTTLEFVVDLGTLLREAARIMPVVPSPRVILAGAVAVVMTMIAACSPIGAKRMGATDRDFLKGYGWTVTGEVAVHSIELPAEFRDEPGTLPIGFYWAYNNELSRDIGLDFASHAGQRVTVAMYALKENLPESPAELPLRAVVVHRDGEIVGAYLDRLGHFGLAASLRGRTFAEIVNSPLETWVVATGVVDYAHPAYQAIARDTPEQRIRAFYEAIDRHDYGKAYSMLNLNHRLRLLFSNRDPDVLYNTDYSPNFGALQNMRAAEVLSIGGRTDITGSIRANGELNRLPEQVLQIPVTVNLELAQELTSRSGQHHFFVSLVQDTPDAPWLIEAFNTGP